MFERGKVKPYPVIGACLSLISLILLAVGVATNSWLVLDKVDSQLNPRLTNSNLSDTERKAGLTYDITKVIYSVARIGLWIGCHTELKGAVSCAYIGFRCTSEVCWVRKSGELSSTTCMTEAVRPVVNCAAYQAVRGLLVLGLLMLVIGVATQVVSLVTLNRTLAMLAGMIIFMSAVFVMTAFAVFFNENWAGSKLYSIGQLGYSFKVIIASWPIALFAGVSSCFAASMGLRHKEVSDYSASNY